MPAYAPIRVSTLRGDQKISFNTYVQVAGKYILLCREGDSFEGDRLEKLRSKKIVKMFIPEEQRKAYDAYLRENLDRAYNTSKDRPIEVRTQIIHGALQAVAEDLIESPEAADFYRVAIDAAKRFIDFFDAENDCLKCLIELNNPEFSISHHGVIVAGLSLGICQELGHLKPRSDRLEPLVVGSLIHDIEHNYNHLNRSTKPIQYSKPEKNIYLKHSIAGHERIKSHTHFDPLVRDIVLNHEESLDGLGPRGKREKEIDPFTLIAATANAFESMLTYEKLTPRDAIKRFLIDKMGICQLESMRALQNSLKKRAII